MARLVDLDVMGNKLDEMIAEITKVSAKEDIVTGIKAAKAQINVWYTTGIISADQKMN